MSTTAKPTSKSTRIIPESDLPEEVDPFQAVATAYPGELARCYESLVAKLPVLIECEKELAPYIYRALRDRLSHAVDRITCMYLDGRPAADLPPPPPGVGLIAAMIHQIREVVRGNADDRVIVIPHLDMLAVSAGGSLGMEARELIPLMYENPNIVFLAFKDPSVPLPKAMENLFPRREAIMGIPRDRLASLVTRREARKFGQGLDPYEIYKHVSGINAVRLRRVLSAVSGEDYPSSPKEATRQLRAATLSTDVQLPNVDIDTDIGGYTAVKDRLKDEILQILAAKDKLSDPEQIKRLENLIPRGMIFWGPPGCIAGDMHVPYSVHNQDGSRSDHKGGTIERLYNRFNGIPTGIGKGHYQRKESVKARYFVPSMDEDGRIFRNEIAEVLDSGMKECLRVITTSGRELICTPDHPLATESGYFNAGEIGVGGKVLTHQNVRWVAADTEKRRVYRPEVLVKTHPHMRSKTVRTSSGEYEYKRLTRARAVFEASLNGLDLVQYIKLLNDGNTEGLTFSDPNNDIHHLDENPLNDVPGNLIALSHAGHSASHIADSGMSDYVGVEDTIESIENVGMRHTYDIRMKSAPHNFVTADFVVHNTGKTLFAKAMATALGASIQIVSGPELKSKWVGESLPYEEEVFVSINGKPQRIAIGKLVEEHSRDDVKTWTVDGGGKSLFSGVTGFLKHKGPNYVDVITTETGRTVTVTGGHSLFIRNIDNTLGDVLAEDIVENETRVAVPLRLTSLDCANSINLLELLADRDDVHVKLPASLAHLMNDVDGRMMSVARFVQVTNGMDINPADIEVYCKQPSGSRPAVMEITEDLCEFLGYFAANGSFNGDDDKKSAVRISSNTERVDYVKALCERLWGHVGSYQKTNSTTGILGKGVDLTISSTLLCHIMHNGLKLNDGAERKRAPAFIFNASKSAIASYLRGYFTGDGTRNEKNIEATTVSKGLASDISTLLLYFGIVARLSVKPEAGYQDGHRIRFGWSGYLKVFANEIRFADSARQDGLVKYLNELKFERSDHTTPEPYITNDVYWDKVVSVKRVPYDREHVYDLSVPATERFIAGYGNILVHNSEENLRNVFNKARLSAPSVIVFDELDSFASQRGTYTGSGVEHSMVNQLLTEMDGFRKEELVFVVGTTNFVESLDAALMRPGRFEFALHIPYPNEEDRKAILSVHNKNFNLDMNDEALEQATRRTGDLVPGPNGGTPYSGDHLQALTRQMARTRMRAGAEGESTADDVNKAIEKYIDKPKLTKAEENVVAVHECGHAIAALFCEHSPPIDRITIGGDIGGALGYVKHSDPAHKYVVTQLQMLDQICILMGGREGESMIFSDTSIGCGSDLQHATHIARYIVEQCGDPEAECGVGHWSHQKDHPMSDGARGKVDAQVSKILERERKRCQEILGKNKPMLLTLRDLLLEKKTLNRAAFAHIFPEKVVTPTDDKVAATSETKSDKKKKAKV